ncbi:MAG: cupin domain-containing protein [Thermomicrobiales bacterium]
MTTLASPTLGGSDALSLWRVVLPAGASGPLHTMSSEQIWTLDSGSAACTVAGDRHELAPGDAIRIAADVPRQFTTESGATFTVCGFGDAIARTDENRDGVVPPWIQ